MSNDPSDMPDDLDSLDDGWDLDEEEEEAAPSTRAVDTAELLRLSGMAQPATPPAGHDTAAEVEHIEVPKLPTFDSGPPSSGKSAREAAKRGPASYRHRRPTPFAGEASRHDVDTSPPPAPADYASTIQRSKAPPMADNPTPLAFAAVRPEAYRDDEPAESPRPGGASERRKTPVSGVDAVADAAPAADPLDDNLSSLGSALDLDLGDLSAPPPPPSSEVRATTPTVAKKAPEPKVAPKKPGGLGLTSPKAAPKPGGLGLTSPKAAPKPGGLGLAAPKAVPKPGGRAATSAVVSSPATRDSRPTPSAPREAVPARAVAAAAPEPEAPAPSADDDFADLDVDVVLDRVSQMPPAPAPPPPPRPGAAPDVTVEEGPEIALGTPSDLPDIEVGEDFPEIEVSGMDDLPDIEIDGDAGEVATDSLPDPMAPSVNLEAPQSAGALSVTDFPLVTGDSPTPDPGEAAPTAEAPADLTEEQLQPIEARFAVGDYSGALILSEGMLEEHPSSQALLRYIESCQDMLRQMYLSRLGQGTDVPKVVMAPDQLRWLTLDHRVGFLLSCLDGISSIDEVLDVAMMPPLEALRTLYELVQEGVIEIASGDPG